MGKVAKKSRWGSHRPAPLPPTCEAERFPGSLPHCPTPAPLRPWAVATPPPRAGSREPGEGAHDAEKSPPRAPLPPAASR